MRKICEKCGQQLQEDDFLCPACGAIWGDRIYRVPTTFGAENADTADAEASYAETADSQTQSAEKKQPGWMLIIASLCVVLAFGLFFIGFDRDLWAGESTTAATTAKPTTGAPDYIFTIPVEPNLPYTVYTVKFVDPYGTPIQGVHIENLWTFISSGIMPSHSVISDKNGTASLIIYNGFENDVYVNTLFIPDGYDQSMVGQVRYYASGQTEMLIVLKFSDELPMEIAPPDGAFGDETYIAYTVQFVDPVGNPVSGVKIKNPISWMSISYLPSDSDGLVTFSLPYEIDSIVIADVPDGYSADLVDAKQSFEGGTYLVIVLKYALDLPTADFHV